MLNYVKPCSSINCILEQIHLKILNKKNSFLLKATFNRIPGGSWEGPIKLGLSALPYVWSVSWNCTNRGHPSNTYAGRVGGGGMTKACGCLGGGGLTLVSTHALLLYRPNFQIFSGWKRRKMIEAIEVSLTLHLNS